MNTIKSLFVFAVIAACMALSPAYAADGLSDAQKTEVKQVIKEYLKENPDLIFTALQDYQQKQAEQMQAMAQSRIGESTEALTGKDLPSTGPADADVTVTEFYDYNCGYCKKAIVDIEKVLETDKKVRFVFKELAILGPTSETAARWSMASHKQGKFFVFHSALMKHTGQINAEELEKVAAGAGLDVAQLKKDAESDEIKAAVTKSRELAMELQIHGTPAFVVGKTLAPGYVGPEGLKDLISKARSGGN